MTETLKEYLKANVVSTILNAAEKNLEELFVVVEKLQRSKPQKE